MSAHLSLIQAVALAFIQGATEFIPVSSSGHLVLLRQMFGWSDDGGLVFDTVLHAGSLAAILVYFWREWRQVALGLLRPARVDAFYRRLPWLLVLATIPAALAGPLLKPFLEDAAGARNAWAAGLSMIATALWFWLCDRRRAGNLALEQTGWRAALWTGCAQVVALLPGASRSGWTTGAGVLGGFERAAAVRFAFYMAVPAIAGALVLQLHDILKGGADATPVSVVLAGFAVSLVVSLLSIRFCLWFFRGHSFRVFRYYLLAVGLAVIAMAF